MNKITKKAFMELHKQNKLNRLGVDNVVWSETVEKLHDKERFHAVYESAKENNTSRLDLSKHDTCYTTTLHGKELFIVEGIHPKTVGMPELYNCIIYKKL